jgi:hypothetical protein
VSVVRPRQVVPLRQVYFPQPRHAPSGLGGMLISQPQIVAELRAKVHPAFQLFRG